MTIRDELSAVLDAEHVEAVIEHRQAKRCKLTPHAARLLARQFALCPDPNEAADEMILRGWTGFRADWLEGQKRMPKPETDLQRLSREMRERHERSRDNLAGDSEVVPLFPGIQGRR